MRWPKGPPHLTPKPSKKQGGFRAKSGGQKTTKTPPPQKKKEKTPEKKIPQMSFSVISLNFSVFFVESKNTF